MRCSEAKGSRFEASEASRSDLTSRMPDAIPERANPYQCQPNVCRSSKSAKSSKSWSTTAFSKSWPSNSAANAARSRPLTRHSGLDHRLGQRVRRPRWAPFVLTLILLLAACTSAESPARIPAPQAAPSAPRVSDPPVGTQPLIDLVAAAGLRWALVLDPAELLATVQHAAPQLLPPARVAAFTKSVGVALNETREVVIAGYHDSTLYLVRAPQSAARIQRRLRRRLRDEPQQDQHDTWPKALAGTLNSGPIRWLAWDPDTSAGAVGDGKLAQAAWLFASGRLRRSPSALHGSALRALAPSSEAPLRLYIAGPLDAEESIPEGSPLQPLAAAEVQLSFPSHRDHVRLWLQMIGDWPQDMTDRWCAWFEAITSSGTGSLLNLDEPVERCQATQRGDRVELVMSWRSAQLIGALDAVLNLRLGAVLGPPEPRLEGENQVKPQAHSH